MIYLDSWQIKPSTEVNSFTSGIDYEAVYVGTELTLDDRVAWIDNYLDGNLPHKVVVRYDAESSQLHFSDSNSAIPIGELQNLHTPRGRILFEATSLLLPELLYLMEWANLAKKTLMLFMLSLPLIHKQSTKLKLAHKVLTIRYGRMGQVYQCYLASYRPSKKVT